MKLWQRLVLALLAVALVPLVVLGLVLGDAAHNRALGEGRAELERDAQVQADRMGRWLADRARFLNGWAQLYPTRLIEGGEALQDGLQRAVYVSLPSAVVVTLVNGEGLAVIPPRFSPSGQERTAASAERATLLTRRVPLTAAVEEGVAIGDPYLPPNAQWPSVPMAALATLPVPGVPNHEVLVLGVEVELTEASALVQASSDDLAYVLLDESGLPLMGGQHPLVDVGLLRPLSQVNARLSFGYQLPGGREVIGGAAPVPGTSLILVVVRPAVVVEAEAEAVRLQVGVAVLFAALVSLWLGWRLSVSLTERVDGLRKTALQVADGKYGERINEAGRDEIGDLARAFNHMSARLAVNQQELEEQHRQILSFNTELQERVDRRTQQLVDAQDQLVRSGQLAAVAEVGAGLAHELNNPLASILGLTQVLLHGREDATEVERLRALESEARRCRDVVAAMQRFASDEVDPKNAPVVDLRDLVTDVSGLMKGAFNKRGVDLQLLVPTAPLPVRVDPVLASRILAQVLGVVRAGLVQGTTLKLSAEASGREVQVVLRPDYPVAIDEFRQDDARAAGLGVWIARRLLQQVGGRLEQPLKVPFPEATQPPQTEELGEDPSLPLMTDATWRVVFPRA